MVEGCNCLGIPYGGKKPCLFIFVNLIPGCALEEPSGPYWCLTFDLGRLEDLTFLFKSYAGHPWFYRFKALGSLQFSLEQSLVIDNLYNHNNTCRNRYFVKTALFFMWGARVAQWWEHSPPTDVAWGSNPGIDTICGLSLLLVLSLAARGFSPGTPVFPCPQKPTFPNSNSTRNQVDEEPLCGCATCKSLFIYLFIYLLLISMHGLGSHSVSV